MPDLIRPLEITIGTVYIPALAGMTGVDSGRQKKLSGLLNWWFCKRYPSRLHTRIAAWSSMAGRPPFSSGTNPRVCDQTWSSSMQ